MKHSFYVNMNRNLPKSIDEIEFIPFIGRDVDLNTKGKPSIYLRNVIIPYYRKVIRGLETEIRDLKKSKKSLLQRKNEQIAAKRWLKHKSNQKRYAVQQSKVRKQAVELSEKKFRKAAEKHPEQMQALLYYPAIVKVIQNLDIKMDEAVYTMYTWNFMFLSVADYKTYFGDSFKMSVLNNCKNKGYIDVQRTTVNRYYLSLKGKALVKSISDEYNKLKNGEA